MPTLPLAVECYHLASVSLGCSYSCCIWDSQFSDCGSHHEVWPTEQCSQSSFKTARATLTNLFLTVVVKDVSCGHSQAGV